MVTKIGKIGGGHMGTALAVLLAEKGMDVTLWAREKEVVNSINSAHRNALFLQNIQLPENITATSSLEECVADKDVLVISTPSQHLRSVLDQISYMMSHGLYIVLVSKGIENGTLKLMNQVAEECIPDYLHKNIFVLSGPTFAQEIANHVPSAAVVASHNTDGLAYIQQLFSSPSFRAYTSSDVTGVELGGALKNVIAIAVGILEGAMVGKNSQAALMTRAIAEITRLVVRMGGNPFTVTGLSGVGDMILTCTGDMSRNRQVGVRLGRGETIDAILDSMNQVAEGVATSKSVYELAQKLEVSMPIVGAVYKVIYEKADIAETFVSLMQRSLKDEFYGYGV